MKVCPKCNVEYQDWCKTCSDCQCELIEKPEEKKEEEKTGVNKTAISIIVSICLFFCGSIISFIGFTKGEDIAGRLSRPKDAMGWEIPEKMILGCTYTPVIIGVALILLSICLFTVLFHKWINNSDVTESTESYINSNKIKQVKS